MFPEKRSPRRASLESATVNQGKGARSHPLQPRHEWRFCMPAAFICGRRADRCSKLFQGRRNGNRPAALRLRWFRWKCAGRTLSPEAHKSRQSRTKPVMRMRKGALRPSGIVIPRAWPSPTRPRRAGAASTRRHFTVSPSFACGELKKILARPARGRFTGAARLLLQTGCGLPELAVDPCREMSWCTQPRLRQPANSACTVSGPPRSTLKGHSGTNLRRLREPLECASASFHRTPIPEFMLQNDSVYRPVISPMCPIHPGNQPPRWVPECYFQACANPTSTAVERPASEILPVPWSQHPEVCSQPRQFLDQAGENSVAASLASHIQAASGHRLTAWKATPANPPPQGNH
ncbi:MAG: hypothetical protein RLZZ179_902 [Verrucomicrobiota bacterium]|jgi:hypothetical protein